MTQTPSTDPVVQAKPQPDIYTLMLIVVAIALAVTIAIVLWNLMSPVVGADGGPGGYGLGLGDLFKSLEDLIGG